MLERLDLHILTRVLSHLEPASQRKCRVVCKRWDAATFPSLSRTLYIGRKLYADLQEGSDERREQTLCISD